MEITAINIQGTVRRICYSTMTMSTYNSVIPYLLWERVPENSWIVCPRYGKKPYDIQLAITGTCWYKELAEKALTREIQEESGLVLTSAPDLLYQTTRGPKNWLWGICNAENCRASRGVHNFTPGGRDDRMRKVGAIMYSTRHWDLVNMIRAQEPEQGKAKEPTKIKNLSKTKKADLGTTNRARHLNRYGRGGGAWEGLDWCLQNQPKFS